jgi:hypothetical protein
LPSVASLPLAATWFAENGPNKLELLRAITAAQVPAPASGWVSRANRSFGAVWMSSSSPASSLRFPSCGRTFWSEENWRARSGWRVRMEAARSCFTAKRNVLPAETETGGKHEAAGADIPGLLAGLRPPSVGRRWKCGGLVFRGRAHLRLHECWGHGQEYCVAQWSAGPARVLECPGPG